MSLNGKVVLVTGGSSGIGAAAAAAFSAAGAAVCVVGRSEPRLRAVCARCGPAASLVCADLARDADVRRVLDHLRARHARLDVLVNNVGILGYCDIADKNIIDVYDEIMNINVRSVILLTNLCIPLLEETRGNIINVSSVAGSSISAGTAAYSVSKAALNHFSKIAALELAPKNIRVNLVSPGPVQTDIFERSNAPVTWDQIKEMTALKKISQPEEVARVILFLAGQDAGSVTGADYLIDCGYLLTK